MATKHDRSQRDHDDARRTARSSANPDVVVRLPAPHPATSLRRSPAGLNSGDVMRLQRTIGNRAVTSLLQRVSAEDLATQGDLWFAEVWMKNDSPERQAAKQRILAAVNTLLDSFGFSVGTGFQPTDPVVRPARKYIVIAKELDKQPSYYAQLFLQFAQAQVRLEDLPKILQEFAIIVYFAEFGRGYKASYIDLIRFVSNISQGNNTWSAVKVAYDPSLTYAEDLKTEWSSQ